MTKHSSTCSSNYTGLSNPGIHLSLAEIASSGKKNPPRNDTAQRNISLVKILQKIAQCDRIPAS
jgi:hypothetical protein